MTAERPVLLLAGGTGGHIFPALAVAEVLARRGVAVAWLGSRGGMEAELVPARGIAFHAIDVRALRGKGGGRLVQAPLELLRALRQAAVLLRRLRPRCVLSFGGYAAGPGGLAAWLARVPLLVHEQNRAPGLTNRVLSRVATRVLSGFDGAFATLASAQWVGNPVRPEIAALAQRCYPGREAPCSQLLVLGGSQGARALNLQLPAALARMQQRPARVLHQCGRLQVDATRDAYQRAGVEAEIRPFIEDMAAAYAEADLVLCRAGALTLAELCAAGRPALLVPFPHAVDDHQTRNAQTLVEAGAAELLPESALNAQTLAERLDALLTQPDLRRRMADAARTLARPEAAEQIAEACLAVAGGAR